MVTSGNLPSQPRGQTESRDGGRPFLACMDDLQNISGLSFRQRHQHPFVNDEQVVLLQLSNALLEGALSSGNSQVLQQFRQPHVFHDKGGSRQTEQWLSFSGMLALNCRTPSPHGPEYSRMSLLLADLIWPESAN